jgi:spore coat protein H
VNDEHLGVYTQVEVVDARFLAENFDNGGGTLYKPEIKAGSLDWTEADVAAETAGGTRLMTTSTTESFNLGGGDLGQIIDRLGEDAGWIPGWTGAADGGGTTVAGGAGQGGDLPAGGFGPGGFLNRDADYLTSVGLRTNENSPDYSGLYRLLKVLNSDPADVSAHDLEEVLQVDEVLRFLAVSVALVHLDNYIGMGHNYYLYEAGGKFWIIPWDLNMSFGGFSSGLSEERILSYFIDEPTAGPVDQYPLVEQLIDEPEYLETYRGYLQQLIEGPFSVERMTARISEIADLIRPYVEKDDHKFSSMEDFEQGLTQDLSSAAANMRTMGGSFIGLTYFVQERTASIVAQLSGRSPAGNGDGSGNGGQKGLAGAIGNQAGAGGLPEVRPGGQQGQQGPPGAFPEGGQQPGGAALPDGAAPPDGLAPEEQ